MNKNRWINLRLKKKALLRSPMKAMWANQQACQMQISKDSLYLFIWCNCPHVCVKQFFNHKNNYARHSINYYECKKKKSLQGSEIYNNYTIILLNYKLHLRYRFSWMRASC